MSKINTRAHEAYTATYIANSNMKYNKIISERKDTLTISNAAKLKQKFNQIKEAFLPKFPNNYLYFENKDCCFFPCHQDISNGMNCMFCRCPLYKNTNCPGVINGKAIILENGIKDCSNCSWNHEYKNAEFLSKYNGE